MALSFQLAPLNAWKRCLTGAVQLLRESLVVTNLANLWRFVVDGSFQVGYVLNMKPVRRVRLVPRPANAVSDESAALLLRISRMTLFRKLKDGTISPPASVEGTRRRWWRPPDIEVAREQLGSAREAKAS